MIETKTRSVTALLTLLTPDLSLHIFPVVYFFGDVFSPPLCCPTPQRNASGHCSQVQSQTGWSDRSARTPVVVVVEHSETHHAELEESLLEELVGISEGCVHQLDQ